MITSTLRLCVNLGTVSVSCCYITRGCLLCDTIALNDNDAANVCWSVLTGPRTKQQLGVSLSVCEFRDGTPRKIICHVDRHTIWLPAVLPPSLSAPVSFFHLVSPSPLLIHEIKTVGIRSSVYTAPPPHPHHHHHLLLLLICPTPHHLHT